MEISIFRNPDDLGITAKVYPDVTMLSREIFREIVCRCGEIIADSFLEKYGNEILASIDKEDIKNICKVQVAKKIYAEMADLNAKAAPFTRSLPEINERFKKEIASILKTK